MTLHKIIFKPNGFPNGTKLAYCVKGQCILDGYKQGPVICCSCYNAMISSSQFEAHARETCGEVRSKEFLLQQAVYSI